MLCRPFAALAVFALVVFAAAAPVQIDEQSALASAIRLSRNWAEDRDRGAEAAADARIAKGAAAAARTHRWNAPSIERVVDELGWALDNDAPAHFATMARVLVHAALEGAALSETQARRAAAGTRAVERRWVHGARELVDVVALLREGASRDLVAAYRGSVADRTPLSAVMSRDEAAAVRALAMSADDPAGDAAVIRAARVLEGQRDPAVRGLAHAPWRERVEFAVRRALASDDGAGSDAFLDWMGTGTRYVEFASVLAAALSEDPPTAGFRAIALLVDVDPRPEDVRDHVAMLEVAFAHPNVWIRRHALRRLASHERRYDGLRRSLAGAILMRLSDVDPWVRALAAYTCAALGSDALDALDRAAVREVDAVASHWLEWARERARRRDDWIAAEVLTAKFLTRVTNEEEEAAARLALDAEKPTERLDAAIALLRAEPATSDHEALVALVDDGFRALIRMPHHDMAFVFGDGVGRNAWSFVPASAPMFELSLAEGTAHCHGGRSYFCHDVGQCIARLGGDVTALHAAVALHSGLHGIRGPIAAVGRLGERRAMLAPFLALDFASSPLGPPRGWTCMSFWDSEHRESAALGDAPVATWENYLAAFGADAVPVLRELATHPEPRVAAAARAHLGSLSPGDAPR